jgi:hypothetical protein
VALICGPEDVASVHLVERTYQQNQIETMESVDFDFLSTYYKMRHVPKCSARSMRLVLSKGRR